MATSPRSELRIMNITEFYPDESREWRWRTAVPNGNIVGDSAEGYTRLAGALNGFFAQQGVRMRDLMDRPAELRHWSKLIPQPGNRFHIRRYAYGAPDPFDPVNPYNEAAVGYVPDEGREDAFR